VSPPNEETYTEPDAPEPTTTHIVVVERTSNEATGIPPKVTFDIPTKCSPVIVNMDPVDALEGVNDVITGGGIKTKPLNSTAPPAVTKLREPDEPLLTTAKRFDSEIRLKDETLVPPNEIAITSLKFAPVIDINFPDPAIFG